MYLIKKILFLGLLLLSISCLAQNTISIQAKITDAITQAPIPYCNIACISEQKGTYSDSTGCFQLSNIAFNDTLYISALAYEKLRIPAHQLQADSLPILALQAISISLPSFIVRDAKANLNDIKRTKVLGNIKEKSTMGYSSIQGYMMAKYIPNIQQQEVTIQAVSFQFKPQKKNQHWLFLCL